MTAIEAGKLTLHSAEQITVNGRSGLTTACRRAMLGALMAMERGFRRVVAIVSAGMFVLGAYIAVLIVSARVESERTAPFRDLATKTRDAIESGVGTYGELTPKGKLLFSLGAGSRSWGSLTQAERDLIGVSPNPVPLMESLRLWGLATVIVVGIAMTPWAAFYSVRWIVRGFTSPT